MPWLQVCLVIFEYIDSGEIQHVYKLKGDSGAMI